MPKLTKFKEKEENKNVKNMIIAASIIVVGLFSFFIYRSYAAYKVEKKYDVIKARIGEFGMPSCKISGNPTEKTQSATLTIEITDPGKNGIAGYSWDGTNYSENNTLEISENGIYIAYVKDTRGNVKGCNVEVTNIETKTSGTLMAYNSSEAFWQYSGNIVKVVFENKLSPKKDAVYTFDVSENQNGSVMSYLVANEENSSTYTLYLQGEGNIKANEDSSYLFFNFMKLTTIEALEYLDTTNVINMSYMFSFCSSLTSLNLSNFNTTNVTNMTSMFNSCSSLTSLDLSNFNTSNVTDMKVMFSKCSNLTNLDLSNFNTSNVTDMALMFNSCSSLTSLDLSNFNTSNVTNMASMFYSCSSLTNLDLSSFDTSKVTTIHNMFNSCSSLINLDISNLDLTNMTKSKMSRMFTSMPTNAIVKVKNEDMQTKILNLSSPNRPSSWTTANVIIAS